MANIRSYFNHRVKPYALLIIAALLAYLPVSSFAYALKNDSIAFDLPIKFFISQCIHNGVQPFWFNTWAMGFPLESILTCSIFSPFQLFFSTVFHYNIYTLHIEFLSYICLSGCGMHYLLKKHFLVAKDVAWLLSLSYMLSGFNVASSQWLWYISAAALIPFVICSMLDLLKFPSWKSALTFPVLYYCMLTSVYIPFSIITTYILMGMVIYKIAKLGFYRLNVSARLILFLAIAASLTILISLTPVVHTVQVFEHLERSKDLSVSSSFFNSNYLHPEGLISLLLPALSAKMHFANTEGTMLNCYLGLFSLLLVPLGMAATRKTDTTAIGLLIMSMLFLLVSFGPFTPLRNLLNYLPGFTYFRHAGIFRLFFLFFLILYISRSLTHISLNDIIQKPIWKRYSLYGLAALLCIYAIIFITHFQAPFGFSTTKLFPLKNFIQSITARDILFFNTILQVCLVSALIISWKRNKTNWVRTIIAMDLIVNTLICTPFFTVSSFSVKKVSAIMETQQGFPVQKTKLSEVLPDYKINNAIWNNVNVYKKQISALESYWGPLQLKGFTPLDPSNKPAFDHPPVYADNFPSNNLGIIMEAPDHVIITMPVQSFGNIYFLQNYYPGWKAILNGVQVSMNKSARQGMEIPVGSGGILELKYRKDGLLAIIIITNLLIFIYGTIRIIHKIERDLKSFSPSSQYQ